MIRLKSASQIEKIRQAGKILRAAGLEATKAARVGISTYELNKIIEDYIISQQATPTFKNYGATDHRKGFPAAICASPRNILVHGIPSKSRILKNGDIVSLDVGTYINGVYGDTAATFVVGKCSDEEKKLVDTTEKCLYEAIKFAKAGNNIYDISYAVQSLAESNGFSVVRDYTGHGIGRNLHEEPYVLNYVPSLKLRRFGPKLKKGYVFAIEPMLNLGTYKTQVLPDEWTVITKDKKKSAHFEHTVVITENEPIVLTKV